MNLTRLFQTRLAKLAFTSAIALTVVGLLDEFNEPERRQHFSMHSDTDKQTQDLWTISVASSEIDIPCIPDPHHNFIVLRDPSGKAKFSIHGFAVDPETGKRQSWGGHDNMLKASAYHGLGISAAEDIIVETDIFCGSLEAALHKMIVATDAANHINDQDCTYNGPGFFREAQNSNSIATTLVSAMGHDFPAQNLECWAPGKNRILLPEEWQSDHQEILPHHLTMSAYADMATFTYENSQTPSPKYTNRYIDGSDGGDELYAYERIPLPVDEQAVAVSAVAVPALTQ